MRLWRLYSTLLTVMCLLAPSMVASVEDSRKATQEAVAAPAASTPDGSNLNPRRVVQEGIAIDFTMAHVLSLEDPPVLREGDDIIFRFAITDTTTKTPLTSVYPAAWMDLRPKGAPSDPRKCIKKAEMFVGGSLFSKAELDLNVYYVLALNDDSTLTVVDPLFGFGGTKLISLVSLPGPGEDWVLTSDQTRLFVSVPTVNRLAVIDTFNWQLLATHGVGAQPTRLVLQPDEQYLWVANDATQSDVAGVTVVTVSNQQVAAHIPTGPGPHDIIISDDNRFAFITNMAAGTVSIVDVGTLKLIKTIKTGVQPKSIAWSPLAQAAYVAHAGDGTVVVIDGNQHEIVARMVESPGLEQIRFAPGGRLGFVVNPTKDEVHIIDASRNRVVQTGDMEDQPYKLAFTDELVYIQHRGSETVLMIPLADVGVEGRPVQVVDFPGGDNPPGTEARPTPADTIVQAPGANAVLVANPADRSIYFYKEGMAAPMGNFSNYKRQSRAVLVVDRSLRDRSSSGVYETVARLRRPGLYDVVFFLDTPRMVHCFQVTVTEDPALEARRQTGKTDIEPLVAEHTVEVGKPVQVQFRLTDRLTQRPKSGVADVAILIYLAPGIWHLRQGAAHRGEGVYAADFVLPQAGIYYAYVASPSLGLSFTNPQYVILQAQNAQP